MLALNAEIGLVGRNDFADKHRFINIVEPNAADGWARVPELQVNLAQSLYKAGMYPEATRAAVRVDSPQYQQRMIALQVWREKRTTHFATYGSCVASCRAHTRDVDSAV